MVSPNRVERLALARAKAKNAKTGVYTKGYGSAKVSKPSVAGALKGYDAAMQTQQHYSKEFDQWANTQQGGRDMLDKNIAKGGPVAQEYEKTGKEIYRKEQSAAARMRAKGSELERVRAVSKKRR